MTAYNYRTFTDTTTYIAAQEDNDVYTIEGGVNVGYVSFTFQNGVLFNNGGFIGSGGQTNDIVASGGLRLVNSGQIGGWITGQPYLIDFGFNGYGGEVDANYTVTNNGAITALGLDGNVTAIQVEAGQGANALRIDNAATGTISGSAALVSSAGTTVVVNAGSVFGTDGIAITTSGDTTIDNSGTIHGSTGSIAASGQAEIENTGTLFGDVVLGNASQQFFNYADGSVIGRVAIGNGGSEVVNDGSIRDSLTLGSGGNVVVNTGRIGGSVSLGGGSDSFDGRRGTVAGRIYGRAGDDLIAAGSEGSYIAGGAGHDNLFAGAGEDTFAFSSFSGSDSDLIHGFNTAHDTIELDHHVFATLKAHAAPTFAIGSKASSRTDFLFYNTSSGVLWYDQDGTGSHSAHRIAVLDPGLHLTAQAFNVV